MDFDSQLKEVLTDGLKQSAAPWQRKVGPRKWGEEDGRRPQGRA